MADFYVDNDVVAKVADRLWDAGHTAVTARDLGLESATDDEQLTVAAQRGRIFVTHNEGDFILLHDAWQRWTQLWQVHEYHAGVLVVPQGHRWGVVWDDARITRAIDDCVQTCLPIANQLLRWNGSGWQRRQGRSWIPSASAPGN